MISFEIQYKDLLARVGKFKTKSGIIETPAFLPVINPAKKVVTPKDLWEDFNCKTLITNAYIIKKHFGEEAIKRGIHKILDFPGIIMTDSGAYQILAYGSVEITNEEIIKYQEEINTDIATILDLPTGWKVTLEYAKYTVEETFRRAKDLEALKKREDIAWVGPIQGGSYIDLVTLSAKKMGSISFDIHALGSPTPVMEQYLFSTLVDMIAAAKMNIPINRPLHLFGAGHPFMFSLVIALGCDLFDSAAYSLFAQEDRYLTDQGTIRLEDLEYLPCSCQVCAKREPRELREMPKSEREKELSRHNLYVCFAEVKRIKQAIVEGRLWEYMEMKAHSHPSLLQALKGIRKYSEYIEKHSPYVKRKGLFFFSSIGLARPEVIRHTRRLKERYTPPKWAKILLLIPDSEAKKVRRRKRLKKIVQKACESLKLNGKSIHACFYSPPFGIIPLELAETFPLFQYEYAYPPDNETMNYMVQKILEYIANTAYASAIILTSERDSWSKNVANLCIKKAPEFKVKSNIIFFSI